MGDQLVGQQQHERLGHANLNGILLLLITHCITYLVTEVSEKEATALELMSEPESWPRFSKAISNVTVNVGKEAVLECRVTQLGKYKVGWLKARDQTILVLHKKVITHNNRIEVDHEDHRIWRLKIRPVRESDRGCYMCQINTEVMKKQIGCIDVQVPPDIDDEQTSSDVVVNEGESAQLRCRATGHPEPEITWSREDRSDFPVVSSNVYKESDGVWEGNSRRSKKVFVSRYVGSELRLMRVQRQQMGAYMCIASNDVPPAVSKRIILSVNFAPEIVVPSQLYGVSVGSSVTISCRVQAFPPAITYWMRNTDRMIMRSQKYDVSTSKRSAFELTMTLTVRDWRGEDDAHFTCTATNSLGKAEGKIQVYTYERSRQEEKEKEDVVVHEKIPKDVESSADHEQEDYRGKNDHNGRNQDSVGRVGYRNRQRDRYSSPSSQLHFFSATSTLTPLISFNVAPHLIIDPIPTLALLIGLQLLASFNV